jgi:DNA-binding MarR family transcriptional regulator
MPKPLPLQAATPAGPAFQKPDWLVLLRELVRCYQSFESFSATHIRTLGLTPSQFDIVVTLGNTRGMSCRELGERTLITKGTLTGVLDRLETKGLVVREESAADRRSFTVKLTKKGEACFERVFPAHLSYMDPAFATLSVPEREQIASNLARLRAAFRGSVAGDAGPAG